MNLRSNKTILMIQPSRIQGRIWQAAIRSQNLPLIWEADDFPLQTSLNPANDFIYLRPALLLFDMGTKGVNPYDLCRWVRDHCPDTKILLTNSTQNEVTSSERQWAINQGALEIIPKFKRKSLIFDVTYGIKRILDVLDCPPLKPEPLSKLLHQLLEASISKAPQSSSPPPSQSLKPRVALSFRGSSYTKEEQEENNKLKDAALRGVPSGETPSPPNSQPSQDSKFMRRYRGIPIEESSKLNQLNPTQIKGK